VKRERPERNVANVARAQLEKEYVKMPMAWYRRGSNSTWRIISQRPETARSRILHKQHLRRSAVEFLAFIDIMYISNIRGHNVKTIFYRVITIT
jgi:hypothetical protein